ncbi:MAG TPA: N-acetylmuramoyl-L-alanine amidase [Burkholderiales bacterium]|nr:N-acetylmuramoyl-L-alanine amidase [Burkholderiales bacterium]
MSTPAAERAVIFLIFGAGLWLGPEGFAASIAVDVGHYLSEPGVISARGVPEFDYNLRLAREISDTLRRAGHRTLLIGDDGLAENLGSRAPRAAGMDLFVSIHHDSVQPRFLSSWESGGEAFLYSDRFSGFSLFVSRLNSHTEASLKCASAIGAALRSAGFVPSRYHADPIVGESRPFADEANGVHYFDNLAVLKTASIPALLFEAGVIVNRDEELRMRDSDVRRSISGAVLSAVSGCLDQSDSKAGK